MAMPRQVIQQWYIFAVIGIHAVLVLLLIRLWHGNAEVRPVTAAYLL